MKLKKATINYCYTHDPERAILDYLDLYPESTRGYYNQEFDFNHLDVGQGQIVIFTKHIGYSTECQVFVNAYKRVA